MLTITISFESCSNGEHLTPTNPPVENPDKLNDNDSTSDNKRSLVVYFSYTNTTKGIAEQIANVASIENHQIVPEVAYTVTDLDYNNSLSRANREQNNPSSPPDINWL